MYKYNDRDDWSDTDFSKTDNELCVIYKQPLFRITKARRKYAPETYKINHRLKRCGAYVDWDNVDWTKTDTEIMRDTWASEATVKSNRRFHELCILERDIIAKDAQIACLNRQIEELQSQIQQV